MHSALYRCASIAAFAVVLSAAPGAYADEASPPVATATGADSGRSSAAPPDPPAQRVGLVAPTQPPSPPQIAATARQPLAAPPHSIPAPGEAVTSARALLFGGAHVVTSANEFAASAGVGLLLGRGLGRFGTTLETSSADTSAWTIGAGLGYRRGAISVDWLVETGLAAGWRTRSPLTTTPTGTAFGPLVGSRFMIGGHLGSGLFLGFSLAMRYEPARLVDGREWTASASSGGHLRTDASTNVMMGPALTFDL